MYEKKEYPTLMKLHQVVKEGGRTTLWKFLHKMGFRYKTVNDKHYVYEDYEQPRIIEWRYRYLKGMRENDILWLILMKHGQTLMMAI